jgi:hypothetical protein
MQMPIRAGRDQLAAAALVFLTANLLHTADHLRQHLAGVGTVVLVGGALLTAAAVAVAVRALQHHPRAPLFATTLGFTAALLVAASHIAPHWSVLSDSYVDDIHPDALAWAVMALEVATGLLLGVAGAVALRARPRATAG